MKYISTALINSSTENKVILVFHVIKYLDHLLFELGAPAY